MNTTLRNRSLRSTRRALLTLTTASVLACSWLSSAQAATVESAVAELQHEWESIRYQAPAWSFDRTFNYTMPTASHQSLSFDGS